MIWTCCSSFMIQIKLHTWHQTLQDGALVSVLSSNAPGTNSIKTWQDKNIFEAAPCISAFTESSSTLLNQ